MTTVVATGADARYGSWLLNMLGSLHANARGVADHVVAYDLGLTRFQRRLLGQIRGVEVREVPEFVPHWREGRTWKTWIWTHQDADRVIWLDAGLTVLRPLDELVARIDELGYFAVSQGQPLAGSIPSDYYPRYGIPRSLDARTTIASGIFGFATGGAFYDEVVVPTHEDCLAGLSVGFSPVDATRLNAGLDRTDEPVLRDCASFRWDQTILNIRFHLALADPRIEDLDRLAGWHSPRDHPEQVIWSHRRRGDLAYLPRLPFRPAAWPAGKAWAASKRARWWATNHSWLFRPATYVRKARRLLRVAAPR